MAEYIPFIFVMVIALVVGGFILIRDYKIAKKEFLAKEAREKAQEVTTPLNNFTNQGVYSSTEENIHIKY